MDCYPKPTYEPFLALTILFIILILLFFIFYRRPPPTPSPLIPLTPSGNIPSTIPPPTNIQIHPSSTNYRPVTWNRVLNATSYVMYTSTEPNLTLTTAQTIQKTTSTSASIKVPNYFAIASVQGELEGPLSLVYYTGPM